MENMEKMVLAPALENRLDNLFAAKVDGAVEVVADFGFGGGGPRIMFGFFQRGKV